MKQEVIEKYIEIILGKQLRKFNINDECIQKINESIRKNIYSLIYHWKDIDFRKAILITGVEEAEFYEPEAPIDIKAFVVVAIRNSYLEQIFCDDCHAIGMENPIEETEIKEITKEAIEYFQNINFEDIAENMKLSDIDDKYRNIVKKYPMAWKGLIELAKCKGKSRIYDREIVEKRIEIEELKIDKEELSNEKKNNVKEVESGITEKLSSDLIKILKYILQEKGGIIYVDCFKMLTRNFEKLLKVMEIILENESYFLTSNYMIANTYIGKRKKIYRAAHTTRDMEEKMQDSNFLNDLSKTHRIALKSYIDNHFAQK